MPLSFVLFANRRLESFFLVGPPSAAFGLNRTPSDPGKHRGRLFSTHHRDARIRPHPEEPWRIGAPTHAVVARTERATNNDRKFWWLVRCGQLRHVWARL